MSLSISATTYSSPSFDVVAVTKPAAKLTVTQQLHDLASEGHSAKQIATTLGLPESEVEEALGTETTATALPAGLSIRV